jgi:hypothetical protein
MKRIFKRVIPFLAGGAVVLFAACQDSQPSSPTDPGVTPLEGRGGNPPQRQINQAINAIWPGGDPDRSTAHGYKSDMFDAVGDGDEAGAQAAAVQIAAMALSALQADPGSVDESAVQSLLTLLNSFAGLPLIDPGTLGPNAGVGAATTEDGGVITSDPDLGEDAGFAGVQFEPGDLPQDVVVIVERHSQPCHPVNQLPSQFDDCVSITTIPELTQDFPGLGVVVGVCTDLSAPNLHLLRLFESQGPASADPVVLLPEEATPSFLVGAGTPTVCQSGLANIESNWLENLARAGWDKVGRPVASLFAPEPLHAATFLATSGSLGGRTKNFSNIGWAEVGIDDGFEVPSGWTPTGFWHRSTLKTGGSPITNAAVPGLVNDLGDGGAMPNPFAGSWVFWFGEDATGNYLGTPFISVPGGTSNGPNSGTLTSPVIVVPADEGLGEDAVLRFNAWFEIESVDPNGFDIMEVWVVEEVGGARTSLGTLNPTVDPDGDDAQPFTSGGGFNAPATWVEKVVSLGAFRGKNIRLEFDFDTDDSQYNGFRGWLIDNVRVASESTGPSLQAAGSSTGGLNQPQPARPRD